MSDRESRTEEGGEKTLGLVTLWAWMTSSARLLFACAHERVMQPARASVPSLTEQEVCTLSVCFLGQADVRVNFWCLVGPSPEEAPSVPHSPPSCWLWGCEWPCEMDALHALCILCPRVLSKWSFRASLHSSAKTFVALREEILF